MFIVRYFTERPHFLGSARNNELADYIARQWTLYGFDQIEMPKYDVLVSLPEKRKPSKVEIIDAKGDVKFKSQEKEKVMFQYLLLVPSIKLINDFSHAH